MVGNKIGGRKTAARLKEKFGANFYSEIGRRGGKNGSTGGFASSHKLAVRAGKLGGASTSRRNKTL